MELSEYVSYDAIGLGQLVSRGEVSPQELAHTALKACELVNPRINAVIEAWEPEVSDLKGAQKNTSPLSGVPFLIKDVGVAMSGKKLEFGSRLCRGFTPNADSILMHRFREAGLVTLGRTTTPEFALSVTTESAVCGPTRNPWDTECGTGGSSGGAAAAVAAGIVPLAHATDAAGSLRIPSASCGVFGLKPSRGRVSNGPMNDEAINGMAVQLGVSRSVRDSAALLDAVQGAIRGEPFTIASPAASYLTQVNEQPGKLKIGVMSHAWGGQRTTHSVLDSLSAAAKLCSHLGHEVEDAEMPLGVTWEAFVHACSVLFAVNSAKLIGDLAAMLGRNIDDTTLEPQTLAVYQTGLSISGIEVNRAIDLRNSVTRSVAAFFSRYDLLLTPSLPEVSPRVGTYALGAETMSGHEWTDRQFAASPFTPVFNAAGLPAMSVPLFNDPASGLPIGMQFVASAGREDLLFRVGGQLEREMAWARRTPNVWAAL